MEKMYDEIVFTKNNWIHNPEESRKDLFTRVGEQLALLLGQGYECRVRDDDTDIVVIEFNHDNHFEDWGSPRLMWITDEEHEDILYNRLPDEEKSDEEY